MAQSIEKTNNQMLDELFQAIDVITTKRLENLQFDKTITCQIVDTSNSDEGEYIVSDGSTEFFAYSENSRYREGTWVYVTIPNGDFTQTKYITGKYISGNTEYSTYINPFDTYIDITGNLLTIDSEATKGLVANNSDKKEVVIWRTGELSITPQSSSQDDTEVDTINNTVSVTTEQLSQFDRLGLRASFKSLLGGYKITSGHYGLRLDIASMDPGSTSTVRTNSFANIKLDSDNMFGNPYNFVTWSQQQLVFDISSLDNIIGMQLVFYQDDDFYDENNNYIPLIDRDNEQEWNAYLSMANLLTKDIYLSLGYDLQNFTDNKIFLYSFEPLTYASYLTDINRTILEEKYPSLNLNETDDTDLGLQIINEKNIHLRWVHLDDEDSSIQAIDNIEDIETWENDDYEDVPLATVHWYRWKMEEGIEDNLAGVFWEEQNGQNGTANLVNYFNWENFQPNPMAPYEKIKTIIEYPSTEYLEYEFQNNLNGYLDSLPSKIIEDKEIDTNDLTDEEIYQLQLANELYISRLKQALIVFEEQYKEDLLNAAAQYPIGSEAYYQAVSLLNDKYNYNNFSFTIQQSSGQNEQWIPTEEEWSPVLEYIENYHISYLNQRTLYESDILEFTNEHDVPDLTSIELVRGLKIVCDADPNYGLNGVYHIYNTNGQIMNSSEASKIRFLSAEFDKVITGDKKLDKVETIKWYFPVENTMIELPVEGCEYSLLEENKDNSIHAISAGLVDGNQWFCIERQGVAVETDRVAGEIVPTALEQIFRIKSYYTQTAINNTVRCEIYKNNKTFAAEYTIYFGVHGTNGTDYTLTVSYEEYKNGTWVPMVTPVFDWHGGPIKLVPHVFNYQNIEVTDDYDENLFTYMPYSVPLHQALEITQDGKNFILERKNDLTTNEYNDKTMFYHYIIEIIVNKAVEIKSSNLNQTLEEVKEENPDLSETEALEIANELSPSQLTVDLTVYCPIAVRFDNTYTAMDGDNRIIYDPTGVNPMYYKGQYTLYKIENNKPVKQEGINWFIQFEDSVDATKFYPQIDATTGELVVPSMYMATNDQRVSILAKLNNQVVWCQPLHIYQEVYASTMLNSWDGSLTIDEDNGTIMSAMVGAGYKDDENRFNGVLMGNVAKKIGVGKSSDTGVFGYHEGEQSFGLKIDGTAFFGKSGHGRIEINGNTGVIRSADYKTSDASGMEIDIDNGIINIKGALDTTTNKQAKVHLGVEGTTSDPYLQIIDDTENNTKLIHISKNQEYIQSTGFSDTNRSGIKFDLFNKKLTGYNFTLKALSEYPADSGNLIGLTIDSAGNPFINVKAAASYEDHDIDIIEIFRISQNIGTEVDISDGDENVSEANNTPKVTTISSKFFLKSSNYKVNKSGTLFDVENGKITSYNFSIVAKYGVDEDNNNYREAYVGKYIRINSGATKYPIIVGQGSGSGKGQGDFAVSWDGSVYATTGEIGGWGLTQYGLFSDGIPSDGESAATYGVSLFSSKFGSSSDSPRISVGTVRLTATHWIDVNSVVDDEDNQDLVGHNWITTNKSTYDGFSGDKYIAYSLQDASATSFLVTRNGQLTATNAILPKATITSFYSNTANITTVNVGTCNITSVLKYKGQTYSAKSKSVVTSLNGGSVNINTYSLNKDTTTLSYLSEIHFSKNDDGYVTSVWATGHSSGKILTNDTSLSSGTDSRSVSLSSPSKSTIRYLGR